MPEVKLSEQVKTADWKSEKHVPVIECPDTFVNGEMTAVKVSIGKEVAHPNTTEHHIRWIELYFQPEKGNLCQIAHFEFCAHGESTVGPNQGPAYTHHEGATQMKTTMGGTLLAMGYCNIHGLWQSSKAITVS